MRNKRYGGGGEGACCVAAHVLWACKKGWGAGLRVARAVRQAGGVMALLVCRWRMQACKQPCKGVKSVLARATVHEGYERAR